MSELLFHPSIYDDRRPAQSYWEATAPPPDPAWLPLAGEERCDVAVIGGGFTGLSAALHLARDHDVDVRVLESGPMGWGASGRNGGFCCLPATKLSIREMIDRYGLEETQRFYAAQLEGMELVRALAEDESIACDRRGDGNLIVAHKPSRLRELHEEAEALSRYFGIRTRVYNKIEFAEAGHDSTEQFGALHMAAGFALHPLKFALGLAQAAARRGAVLHPHSRVLEWTRSGGEHRLATAGGVLRASRVVIATNGFTREGLHPALDGRLLPAISNVVTTRPLSAEELERQRWKTENPICNTRTLLFYYRMLPDRSFLFGARGCTTGRPEDAARMRAWMIRRLHAVFPGWREVPITHFWRGLVCLSRKLTPSIGRLEDDASVWYGFGYHANGVNTAPWAGMRIARWIAGAGDAGQALPAAMRGLPERFPLPARRLWALRGAYLYYRVQDWVR